MRAKGTSRRAAAAAGAFGACAAVVLGSVPAATASAPVPHTYAGYVKSVQDGDTFTMQMSGSNLTWQWRSSEINAPETRDPVTGRVECQAYTARAFLLNRLMRPTTGSGGRTVYVPRYAKAYSTNPAERSLGRHVGQPYYSVWNGTASVYRSATRDLVQAGLAMWEPEFYATGESDAGSRNAWWDVWYAWGKKVGLFNPTGCGSDQPTVTVQGWLDWDSGTRSKLAGETITFRNTSPTTLSLAGWSLRSGQPETYRPTYRFPANAYLRPGDVVRLHFGSGTNAVTTRTTTGTAEARTSSTFGAFTPAPSFREWNLYMGTRQGVGLSDPANSRTSSWAMFYLQDRYLNVRSIAATPCYGIASCTDPRKGAFTLSSASPRGDVTSEYVDVVATRAVDTTGLYAVVKPYSVAWAQPFPDNLRMQAGDVLRFHTGRGVPHTDANGVTHMYLNIAGVSGMSAFATAVRGFLDESHPAGWFGVRSNTDEKIGCWSLGGGCPSWLR